MWQIIVRCTVQYKPTIKHISCDKTSLIRDTDCICNTHLGKATIHMAKWFLEPIVLCVSRRSVPFERVFPFLIFF